VVQEARRIAMMVENLPEEQLPPESLWHSPQKCAQWIKDHPLGGKQNSGGFLEFKDTEVEKAN
jgi:hypothetical protein